jgi:uncharacterized membrane protein
MMRAITWVLFIASAVLIGLYPLVYIFFDMGMGLLSTKPHELLEDRMWKFFFTAHILPGGVALLSGWSQFVTRIRNQHLQLHRWLGRVYLVAVSISGVSALYIAVYATGGVISQAGFGVMGALWLLTTLQAYRHIRNRRTTDHQYWMIRSYSLCFAAVTLRLWLPLLDFGVGLGFEAAYRAVAWLCWVPNLMVAERIVWKLKVTADRYPVGA